MFCGQCGAELLQGDKFCRKCGTPVEEPVEIVSDENSIHVSYEKAPKKKNKTTIIVAAVIILIAAVAAVLLMTKGTGTKKQYEDLLASGNRYLEELDYENAEIAFLEAIKVDPKKPDAYIQLADTYIDQGKIDEAVEILDEADEVVDDEVIDEKKEEIASYSGYEWYLEPTVEADNIYYIMDFNGVMNNMKKPFYDSYAVIERGGRYSLIDRTGNIVGGDTKFTVVKSFYGDYCMEAADGQTYTCVNGQLSPLLGRGIDVFGFYYKDKLYACYDEMMGLYFDSEVGIGYAIPVQKSEAIYDSMEDGYWADWYLSLTGKYAIYTDNGLKTDFIYDECGSLAEGRFAACLDGKWGYVDEDGNEIIPFQYDASWCQLAQYSGGYLFLDEEKTDCCYAFSEGYVPLVKDGVWELRDIDGNVVLKPGIFEEIRPVYDNKCWVKKEGRWGVIELVFRGEASDEETLETAVDLEGITVEFENFYESSMEYATVTAYDKDGAVLWNYQTEKYDATQLERSSDIAVYGDKYYFVENGTIKALSLIDGSLVWENSEFGGNCPRYDFDKDGTLYICGYFGPDLFVVDKNGETVTRTEMFSNDYFWPSNLEYADGQVIITFDGGPEGDGANAKCYIDTKDYSYSF